MSSSLISALLRLPRHRSEVHVRERDRERRLHSLRLHALLCPPAGAVQVIYPPGIQRSNCFLEAVFQSSSFPADGHNGPDEDLQAAGRSHAHAQRFTPPRIHVIAVVERCVVHLNEDVSQDEQQEKWSTEYPACFEVKQHFAAPGRAVADHVDNVLTKLVDSIEEGDANAHEEGDDDEAEASGEGVNESEPVNPSIGH